NSRIFLSKSNSGRLSRIRTVITNSGAFIPAINYREFPLYVLNLFVPSECVVRRLASMSLASMR
ncbi:MAG: hypothetical protein ACLPN1_01575, partial [Dissulfurispiraceae bacterium]